VGTLLLKALGVCSFFDEQNPKLKQIIIKNRILSIICPKNISVRVGSRVLPCLALPCLALPCLASCLLCRKVQHTSKIWTIFRLISTGNCGFFVSLPTFYQNQQSIGLFLCLFSSKPEKAKFENNLKYRCFSSVFKIEA
jgi:hypothetical protein